MFGWHSTHQRNKLKIVLGDWQYLHQQVRQAQLLLKQL